MKTHKYRPICRDGAQLLTEAILWQAGIDWRESDKVLKSKNRKDLLRLKKDVERFFRSQWFADLTGLDGRSIFLELSGGKDFMEKPFCVGMYDAKYVSTHYGDLCCLEVASKLCDKVYLIWGNGGDDEERIKQVDAMFDNVVPVTVDLSTCRAKDGNEDWDMAKSIITEACGEIFDAVFGIEEFCASYFNRVFPDAEYVAITSG